MNRIFVYFLAWMDSHPGGKEILLLGAGRDITHAFASYHPFTTKPEIVIERFKIGSLSSLEFPAYSPDTGFYKKLRERVGDYFKSNNLDSKPIWPGIWRMALVLGAAYLCYFAAWGPDTGATFPPRSYVRVMAAVLFGILQALPLLHVMHDSSHLAFGMCCIND